LKGGDDAYPAYSPDFCKSQGSVERASERERGRESEREREREEEKKKREMRTKKEPFKP